MKRDIDACVYRQSEPALAVPIDQNRKSPAPRKTRNHTCQVFLVPIIAYMALDIKYRPTNNKLL